MKFITDIFYYEKGCQFRKVIYYSNLESKCIDAVKYGEILLEHFQLKYPNTKGIRVRTFELDTGSYDLQ